MEADRQNCGSVVLNRFIAHFFCRHGLLVCFGNPLLDIITTSNGDELLSKYDLQPNNAILAEEKHKPLYDDLIKNCEIEYIAGGASQNTARIFQVNYVALMDSKI